MPHPLHTAERTVNSILFPPCDITLGHGVCMCVCVCVYVYVCLCIRMEEVGRKVYPKFMAKSPAGYLRSAGSAGPTCSSLSGLKGETGL